MPEATTRSGESEGRFETPQGCAGFEVRDPRGEKVGKVEEVYANGGGEAEYVVVRTGLFGARSVLLPVRGVAVDRERRVLVLE